MANDQAPLVGLLQALQGNQQAPLASLPDVGAPLIGSGPQISPGLPWANRAADLGSRYVGDQVSGLAKLLATPGAAAKPNPYPAGSEESAWYDQNRQDAMNHWAPGMALGMIGSGTPFAEAGALGMGGGRPTFASNAAARAEINEATALIDKYYKPKMTPEERQQVLDAISRKSQAQQYIMQTQGNIVQGHVPSDNPVVEAAHRSLSSASDWMRNQRQSAPPWSWRNQ